VFGGFAARCGFFDTQSPAATALFRANRMSRAHLSPTKALSLIVALFTFLVCSGCSSFLTHRTGIYQRPQFYPGAIANGTFIVRPSTFPYLPKAAVVTYGAIDFVPSAALDTLFLPIDLAYQPTNTSRVAWTNTTSRSEALRRH